MSRLALALLILAAGLAGALLALDDPGYVLIARPPWSAESSLAFFLVLLALSYVLVYYLARVLVFAWHTPRSFHRRREHYRLRRARQEQARGIVLLVEEQWVRAEDLLLAHVDDCDTPLINLLGAGVAAQRRGDPMRRDDHLARAHQLGTANALAVGMVQAELQRMGGQTEQALATLRRLRDQSPKNRKVLELSLAVYRELKDWKGLIALVDTLRRRKILDSEELAALEQEAWQGRIEQAARDESSDTLSRLWERELPRRLRHHAPLAAGYARALLRMGRHEQAETHLRTTLKPELNAELVALYGRLDGGDVAARLRTAEEWLKTNPDHPPLLLAAGRLAIKNRIWGRARSYLETAASASGDPAAYLELGRLLEQLDEPEQARECFRRGLERSQGETPQPKLLPAPLAAVKSA